LGSQDVIDIADMAEVAEVRQGYDNPIEEHEMPRIVHAVVNVIEYPSHRRGGEREARLAWNHPDVQSPLLESQLEPLHREA
jgi:hypothetical protein